MKLLIRIVLSCILLHLLFVGISFFIPGRLGFIDRYSIRIEKIVLGQMEKLGSISRHSEPTPYTADAFSYAELKPYLEKIEPGALFFSDQGRAVSSVFISGTWKHCGIFLGSRSQIEHYWGPDHELVQALSPYYSEESDYLIFDSSYEKGVSIHSMVEMADLSAFSTLRQLLFFEYREDSDAWARTLMSGMEHLGKDYDYCFVLDNANAFYCSELLYHLSPVEQTSIIPSKKILGRDFLLPSDLVTYMHEQGVPMGKFVCRGMLSKGKKQLTLSAL